MREASGGRRSAPHAGTISIDNRQRVAQRTESSGGAMRGDLLVRRSRSSEEISQYPWQRSRANPSFFKSNNAFLAVPLRPMRGFVPNAVALLSTSSGNDDKNGSKNTVLTKGKGEDSEEQISNSRILATLAKSLWMKDNSEFRFRVIAALGLLIGAKVLNVQVPFLFKLAVDWLTTASGNSSGLAAFATANSTSVAVFVTPAAVLIGYGIARTGASAFNELRTAVFSKVTLRTIRSVSRKLHHLKVLHP